MSWLANRIIRSGAPGKNYGVRLAQVDGSEVTLLVRTGAIDLCYGWVRLNNADITAFSLSPKTALKLSAWIFWKYWVKSTWCGIRLWLWNWALRRQLEKPKWSTQNVTYRSGSIRTRR